MSEKPSCKTCKFAGALINSTQEIVKVCRFNPPKVFTYLIQTNKGASWATNSAWPGITDGDWCSHHTPDLQLTN